MAVPLVFYWIAIIIIVAVVSYVVHYYSKAKREERANYKFGSWNFTKKRFDPCDECGEIECTDECRCDNCREALPSP